MTIDVDSALFVVALGSGGVGYLVGQQWPWRRLYRPPTPPDPPAVPGAQPAVLHHHGPASIPVLLVGHDGEIEHETSVTRDNRPMELVVQQGDRRVIYIASRQDASRRWIYQRSLT